MLLLIAVGILGLSIMVDGNVVGQAVCSFWLCLGNGVGTFSYHIFLMWNRNLQLTHNLKEAMEMNGHLSRRISRKLG